VQMPIKVSDFISVAEAAVLADRSTGWVREQAACGRIDFERGDHLLVSRGDLLHLVRQRRPKPKLPVPYLQLVIDNT
jgi:hypothetical protein